MPEPVAGRAAQVPSPAGARTGAAAVALLLALAPLAPVQAEESGDQGQDRSAGAGAPPREGPANSDKSIGFYVGKDLTQDGSVLLGGFGHEPSSHWLAQFSRRPGNRTSNP